MFPQFRPVDDVRDDLLTVEAARVTYGVVLDGDCEIDREATRKLRRERRDE